ncbi:MAG: hypothetical protein KKB70_05520 [Proteobacteria bacterium]|nr:hypothetical protein [Pseudomonadota bacterium]
MISQACFHHKASMADARELFSKKRHGILVVIGLGEDCSGHVIVAKDANSVFYCFEHIHLLCDYLVK